MATAVKCVSTIGWRGTFRKPGEVIVDMDDGEAKRLAGLKAVVIQNPAKKADAQSTDAPKT